MKSRVLVTTSLEETWPDEDTPILFLGEWCKQYHKKKMWERYDAIVAAYHWDDRKKLYQDYLYLLNLYEEILKEISEALNEIHRVNYSVRYWRIVVGPWLGFFLQILFDRWSTIQSALLKHDISGVNSVYHGRGDLIPNDMVHFNALIVSDEWNELIYSQILKWRNFSNIKILPTKKNNFLSAQSKKSYSIRGFKKNLVNLVNIILMKISKHDDFFLISSYLNVRKEIQLQLCLGQVPKLWQIIRPNKSTIDLNSRKWILQSFQDEYSFSSLVRSLIPSHIPSAYLEGYQDLRRLTDALPWPQNPRAIITSNSYSADDVFKVWAACKVEKGAPLIIGQHGGHCGTGLWAFTEEHQIAIADYFLSWGWGNKSNNKILNVGNLKGFGKKIEPLKSGKALMVEMTMPRNSYHMYSAPVGAGQWNEYCDEQQRFVRALPLRLRKELIVRLYSEDYGHDQELRWRDSFPEVQVDDGLRPLEKLMKISRLYISTYNATTYLESLSLNFPTIIFWKPHHWELREDAIPYFDLLRSVGIFHDTPEAAARQLELIWDNIHDWWGEKGLQNVRQLFCEKYARIPKNPIKDLNTLFKEISQQ